MFAESKLAPSGSEEAFKKFPSGVLPDKSQFIVPIYSLLQIDL